MLPLARKSILLVEDDAELRGLYRVALRSAGFDVHEVDDGLGALRVLDADSPDLVVLDLWLPMLDGLSVLDELATNSHTRDIPIIVVTGTEIDPSSVRADSVLRKPVDPFELVAAVRAALRRVAKE